MDTTDTSAFITGETTSSDFPTLNPFQNNNAGNYDAFVGSFLSNGFLPVELSLFSAMPSADGVTLQWRTETETNNYGFDVERLKEGSFYKVGFVRGNGTTVMPQILQRAL